MPKYFTMAIGITIKAADISIFCMKLLMFMSSKFLFESSFTAGILACECVNLGSSPTAVYKSTIQTTVTAIER